MKSILIVDTHLIDYHIDVFNSLGDKNRFYVTLFLSNINLKQEFERECDAKFNGDIIFEKNKFLNYLKIILIAKHYDILIIHGYNHFFNFYSSFIFKFLGKKIIFRGEGDFSQKVRKNIFKKIYLKIFSTTITHVSYSYKNNFIFLKDIFKNKPFIFYPSSVSRIRLLNSIYLYPIDDQSIVYTYAGRFTERKGIDRLIQFINNLDTSLFQKTMVFNFIGNGNYKSKLLELSNQLKNSSSKIRINIYNTLTHKELMPIIYNSSYVILASYYDPSPKIIVESINLKIPVIVSENVGFVGDFLINNYNSLIFSDLFSFQNAIIKSHKKEIRDNLINGIDRTLELWNLDTGSNNYSNILNLEK